MLGVRNMSFTVLGSRFSVRVQVQVHGRRMWRPIVCTLVAPSLVGGGVAGQQPAPRSEAVDSAFTAGASDPASLTKVVDARLARAQQLLNELLSVKGTRTIANTLEPY